MNEEIIKELNHLQRIFIQMYINFLAEVKKEELDDAVIEYLNTSATATREYMKALGSWDNSLDDKVEQ